MPERPTAVFKSLFGTPGYSYTGVVRQGKVYLLADPETEKVIPLAEAEALEFCAEFVRIRIASEVCEHEEFQSCDQAHGSSGWRCPSCKAREALAGLDAVRKPALSEAEGGKT